jgi:hypothetical protein
MYGYTNNLRKQVGDGYFANIVDFDGNLSEIGRDYELARFR